MVKCFEKWGQIKNALLFAILAKNDRTVDASRAPAYNRRSDFASAARHALIISRFDIVNNSPVVYLLSRKVCI